MTLEMINKLIKELSSMRPNLQDKFFTRLSANGILIFSKGLAQRLLKGVAVFNDR